MGSEEIQRVKGKEAGSTGIPYYSGFSITNLVMNNVCNEVCV
jgi:hypothetical protein